MITREQVKGAIECRWRLRQIIICGIIWLGVVAMAAIVELLMGIGENVRISLQVTGVFALVYGVMILPFFVYSLWQYLTIIKNWQRYELHEVTLNNPSISYAYRRSVYYTVGFLAEDGELTVCKTRPIWSSAFYAAYAVEDYHDKKVDVLYDPKADRLVVLGLSWQ